MADFQSQVNAITSLGIDGTSASPKQVELSQFLIDGVIDVTNKYIQFKPQDKDLFMNVTGLQVAQGANIDAADIISVVRADGITAGDFRSCRKISPSMQSRVADVESFHFASKFNPVYMLNADGTVHVFPAPSDNSGKDSYKVYYVNNTPLDGSGTALTYADSTLGYFPADKIYLVVIYAAIKSLQSSLSSVDISTFSLTAVPPVIPSLPVISSPGVSSTLVAISGTPPVYISPVVAPDFSDANTWINTEEDSEMVASRVQVIGAQLQEFQTKIQDSLNNFNKENTEYQAFVQQGIQQSQINAQEAQKEADLTIQADIQDYTLELQKYSIDLQKYQADIGKDVQVYKQEIEEKSAEYQWKVGRLQDLKQEYNQTFAMMAPPVQPQQQVAQRRR